MKISDIMTFDPACCTSGDTLEHAARLMVENDCGEIPVVDDLDTCLPIGVITDRDIVCRTIAKGKNPLDLTVGDCMTSQPVTIHIDSGPDECYKSLEENQIRRIPVVDNSGKCVGIVSLADVALHAARSDSAEILREVSESRQAHSAG